MRVFAWSHLPFGEESRAIQSVELATVLLGEETYTQWVVTAFDESAVLFSRGKLWRVNPTSARGMKQGLRVI
jgi:hypothetical protein